MMNPDMAAIAIDSIKRKSYPSINTNGGIGKAQDYFDMAQSGVRIMFDVEGSTQQIHQRYRQGVNFSNLIKNIESAHRGWDTIRNAKYNSNIEFYVIPWAHTIADLKNIIDLAHQYEAHITIPRPRFVEGGTPCFDRNGKIVDFVTLSEKWSKFKYGTFFYGDHSAPTLNELLNFDWGDPLPITNTSWYGMDMKEKVNDYQPYQMVEGLNYYNQYSNPVKVNCKVEKQNSVFISYDLKLLPCCHLGTHITGETAKLRRAWDEWIKLALNHYAECGDEVFDLRTRKFDEIVNDPVWRRFAFAGVEGTKILKYCETICGLCS
jgi:hypothetical protein